MMPIPARMDNNRSVFDEAASAVAEGIVVASGVEVGVVLGTIVGARVTV